ncbi:hypothetical protein I4U23_027839 [Adineta vaga]|nr:hypothetical protein I4U23_027839 [Adineta vaga]
MYQDGKLKNKVQEESLEKKLLDQNFGVYHLHLLIDQTYLPSIGMQAQRMRMDYDLLLLQSAQECCQQGNIL